MDRILTLTLLMALVTALPRLLPMWFLPGRRLPSALSAWLRFIPVAVIAAILGTQLFVKEGDLFLSRSNLYLWAAFPTFAVGVWKRNLALTVVTGIGSLALIRHLI